MKCSLSGIAGTFLVMNMFAAGSANAIPIQIIPPTTLTIDSMSVTSGTFNVTGVTAYSDPGGIITATTVLDQGLAADDVSIAATIGSGTPHSLFSVPDDTEVMRMIGFFDAGVPDLPPASFDITTGVLKDDTIFCFTAFLPATTAQALSYQITDMGTIMGSLADNTNVFSSTVPILSLIDPGGTRLVLDNGMDNAWYAAYTGAPPLVMNEHGTVKNPEPSSLILTGIGAGAFIVGVRRRRQRMMKRPV